MKRIIIYILGLILLSLGIALSFKADLGVSPIVSVAYNISAITPLSFGVMTFVLYSIMVLGQAVLLGGDFKLYQLLQIGVGLITSLSSEIFAELIPDTYGLMSQYIMLVLSIVLTGVGAAAMVGMKLVPNPPDGLANAIGTKLKKDFSFGKHFFDLFSVLIAVLIGAVFANSILGINIGSVFAMIFTGRVVARMQKPVDVIYKKVKTNKNHR